MHDPDQIIEDLKHLLKEDEHLAQLLEESLKQAHERARSELNQQLYEALDWPVELAQYYTYLSQFIRWIPQQSSASAWKTSAPEERYAKEVSDRLAHFFWMIDQKVDNGSTAIAENSARFRDWLTQFAREWGSYLDTPESFNDDILASFRSDAPEYAVEESLVDGQPNMPSGWLSFDQFFARQLNPGLRPRSSPDDNHVVTSPADCSFQHSYAIDSQGNIPDTTIKNTHRYGNIAQLLQGSRYADAFANGTFVHYMLPPSAYHRFHLPVSGRVEESYVIQGQVFMQVDLENHELISRDSTRTGYEFSQTRGVLTLDTGRSEHGNLGVVAVVPVGMSHVASVMMTAVEGTDLDKGDEFGYFQFGGSDIIIVFQDGIDVDVDTSTDGRKVGSIVATAKPQLAPAS